ncbi:phosphonate C-P lyase system protein PhnG [Kiloniella antarctica]|uniref:Phosphonate C-P lyase system protein PhnG n=1 Tax=Kiloniella antarctica TaxID=1550907 RepID=A0ABW5BK58_9PROT
MTQSPNQRAQSDSVQHRQHWISVLARSSTQELESSWSSFTKKRPKLNELAYRFLRKPETGLVMVRARAGGDGQKFNLGEMSMSRCTVCMENGMVGYSYVKGRDHKHAELAAVFDALLQDETWSEQVLESVISPIALQQKTRRKDRKSKIAASKVDFFTMVRGEDE